jgi:hypothetical protein
MADGRLLGAAEGARFGVIVSSDQSLGHQQNLTGRRIAVVILSTNHWDTIKADPSGVDAACAAAGQGSLYVVEFPLPPRQRPVAALPWSVNEPMADRADCAQAAQRS